MASSKRRSVASSGGSGSESGSESGSGSGSDSEEDDMFAGAQGSDDDDAPAKGGFADQLGGMIAGGPRKASTSKAKKSRKKSSSVLAGVHRRVSYYMLVFLLVYGRASAFRAHLSVVECVAGWSRFATTPAERRRRPLRRGGRRQRRLQLQEGQEKVG